MQRWNNFKRLLTENENDTCEEEKLNFNTLFLLCRSYSGLKILAIQNLFLEQTGGMCK